MDERSYHNLRILEEVEKSSRLTNRFAAQKLGVSVKLAHSVLNGLVKRGFLQMKPRDGRSWNYLLTPAGVREKMRLTYEYLDFSRRFFKEARRRSSEVCLRLKNEGVEQVAFLGCGELAEIAYLGVQENGLVLAAVYDDENAGTTFLGLPVKAISEIPSKSNDDAAESEESVTFSRILITAYDPASPARRNYLPDGVSADERFVWVFDQPEDGVYEEDERGDEQ